MASISEPEVIWKAKEKVESLLAINKGMFETIEINGEVFSTDNIVSALDALEDYIGEIAAKQRYSNTTTPEVTITRNLLEKSITIQ